MKQKIEKLFPKIKLKADSCWINFEYLPNGEEKEGPNFKNHNEVCYNLYDDLKFESFMNDSVKLIEEMIDEQY